jgi:hypothetical protein
MVQLPLNVLVLVGMGIILQQAKVAAAVEHTLKQIQLLQFLQDKQYT